MTYNVFSGTLNLTQSILQLFLMLCELLIVDCFHGGLEVSLAASGTGCVK